MGPHQLLKFVWEVQIPYDFVSNMYVMYIYNFIYTEFIDGVSQFSVRGDTDSKMKCEFNAEVLANNYIEC